MDRVCILYNQITYNLVRISITNMGVRHLYILLFSVMWSQNYARYYICI